MKKTAFITLLLLTGLSLYSNSYSGREIVDSGKKIEIHGDLKIIENELYLIDGNKEFQVHLGPEEYSKEIGFIKKAAAKVSFYGYILDTHLAPITLSIGDDTFEFWDPEGKPLWRGRSYSGKRGDRDEH